MKNDNGGLSEDDKKCIAWMDEKVENIKAIPGVYKLACIMLGKKKMSYKDLYLIAYGVNKDKLGEEKAKIEALNNVIKIYEENNGHLPDNVKEII